VTAAERAAERYLDGCRATGSTPLGGGAFAVTVTGGRTVVAKRGCGDGAAAAEAAGLNWLAEHGDVPIPAVLGHDDEWLVTEHVEGGAPTASAAEEFGRALAATHLHGAPAFGSAPPGGPAEAWIGMAPMRNEPYRAWPEFYAAARVEPYVRNALDRGLFGKREAEAFERVCDRLPEIAGPAEPPARLHGDAWSGNVLWCRDGRVRLIDPAAHGGHRETDLAMLRLFGLPMLDRVLGAYAEAAADAGAPLSEGWRERVELHQVFPLLVHTVLFDGAYAAQAVAAAHGAVR